MSETTPWGEEMLEVVSEIMENTAFTEVRPAPQEPLYDQSAKGVSLLIHDPVQAEFQMFMDHALLKYLAEMVYGPVLGEVDEEVEGDFLAELLNTIAGRFLATVLPPEQSFRLGLPEKLSGPFTCPAPPCLSWSFVIEEMNFSLSLHGETLLSLAEE